jgi:hypothetical protein
MLANVRGVRRRVNLLRAALIASPETLNECIPDIEDAIRAMQQMEQELRMHSLQVEAHEARIKANVLRPELKLLHQELSIVAALTERGFAVYRGLARWMAAATSGYTVEGQPAELGAPHSVSVKG